LCGFFCDFCVQQTRALRRDLVSEYFDSYHSLLEKMTPSMATGDRAAETEKLLEEVDLFRGVPGFYWGIWALIQATISQIDFDYASYAETRLGEYYAWRAEVTGERQKSGKEMPLRERRWAQEE
jgi:ethanolamine kinase